MIHTHPAQDPGLPGSKKEEEVTFWPLESETGLNSTPPSACLMFIYGSQGTDIQEEAGSACGKEDAQIQGHMERGSPASASIYIVNSRWQWIPQPPSDFLLLARSKRAREVMVVFHQGHSAGIQSRVERAQWGSEGAPGDVHIHYYRPRICMYLVNFHQTTQIQWYASSDPHRSLNLHGCDLSSHWLPFARTVPLKYAAQMQSGQTIAFSLQPHRPLSVRQNSYIWLHALLNM